VLHARARDRCKQSTWLWPKLGERQRKLEGLV
jgi:hypothetical protein